MSVLGDPTVKRCFENIKINARTKGTNPNNTLKNYRATIKQFIRFVNSEEGLSRELMPKDLVEEAKTDVRMPQVRIQDFFLWLQGENASESEREKIGKYRPWTVNGNRKSVKRTSAGSKAFSVIRGFYTHNGVDFGKWSTPKTSNMVKTTIENDRNHAVFTYDEETAQYIIDYSQLRFFIDMLSLRDQSILLALLSSGQDVGDILPLKLGWLRDQKSKKRLNFRGVRIKTQVPFWTFFSKEATEMVRRYVKVQRADAGDDDYIWVTRLVYNGSDHGEQRPLSSDYYSSILNGVAEKMGILPEGTTQNPFRPKRMRHLFQTACDRAGISDRRSKTFMGHAGGIEMQYIERNLAEHEAQYAIVEPFVSVYETSGKPENMSELRKLVIDLSLKNRELEEKIAQVKTEIKAELDEIYSKIRILKERKGK